MKLFVIATLIAVSAAARLEHLERGYLPPFGGQADAIGSGPNAFGANSRGPNSFGANGRSGQLGGQGQAAAFGAATSNQYLPPDQGPAGSNTLGSGSLRSPQPQLGQQFDNQIPFGAQAGFGNQPDSQSPFGAQPSSQYGASRFGAAPNSFQGAAAGSVRPGSQYQPSQYSATNRQYLAPKYSSQTQEIPQQDFDEETGYHY